jgi:hypothetical protein
MTTPTDLTNHWPLRGDPTRLCAAAAVLRAGNAEETFGTRVPGEYVMASVARLLETLAFKIHEDVDLGHEVVSAATDIAEHVLAYVHPDRQSSDDAAHRASTWPTAPRRSRKAYEPHGLPVDPGDSRAWPPIYESVVDLRVEKTSRVSATGHAAPEESVR